MNSIPKKDNKRSSKIVRRSLPSQIQQIEKTKEIQEILQTLCEDDNSSIESIASATFRQKVDTKNRLSNRNFSSSFVQKKIIQVESSSESSSVSDERGKSEKDGKKIYTQDFSNRSAQNDKKLILRRRKILKRYMSSNNSSDSTDSPLDVIEIRKSKRKPEIICETIINCRMHSSDSECDENDTKRRPSTSKISKNARQQIKKTNKSYKSRNKAKRYHNSTSEFEDEEHKIQNREKNSECDENDTKRTPSTSKKISKNARQQIKKTDKSNKSRNKAKRNHNSTSEFEDEEHKIQNTEKRSGTKSQLSNIQEDDSNGSSSKEFQKLKFQKVNRNKYSMRQLADLERDYTKSPDEKSSANKSEKHNNQQLDPNLNNIKNILRGCKEICSNFQMYIETVEQSYNRENEEQLIQNCTEKVDKLRTSLEKNQKDLTTAYQLWSRNRGKSATKSHKAVNDDERKSSEESEKRMVSEDKRIFGEEQNGDKAVSECDSEEIFSANESSTAQKTQRKKNLFPETENSPSIIDRINNDKSDVDMRDDLTTSPVLGTLKEKKTSIEQSCKKQLFSECNMSNNGTQLANDNTNTNKQARLSIDIDNNETEIEDTPLKDSRQEKTLENDGVNRSNERNIIDESTDMFNTSLEDAGENRTEVEIEQNCDKGDKEEVSCTKERTSCGIGEERDLSNQVEKKMSTVDDVACDNSKAVEKTNTDDIESLDDAEALAKKALLIDSDTSDTLLDEDIAKPTEDLITNDTSRIERKNETKNNDSDVNSVSTVILPIKEASTGAEKDISTKAKTKVEEESDNRFNKKSRRKISSLNEDEDAEAEKAAKKTLLESNSDDSLLSLSEYESEKLADKKSETDSSEKNAKAKLLASSNSDDSSSESALSLSETTNISKNRKRKHEPESNEESIVARLLKKRRFKLNENYHYKNDKKLRMSCQIHVKQLSAHVLKRYSRALEKSRKYLEHKALKSLINLDKLEKSCKRSTRHSSDSLMDSDLASKISKSPSKRQEKAKEESLMDHLKKVENGNISPIIETNTDMDELVDQSKIDDVPLSNEDLISEANRIAKENLLNSSDEKEAIVSSDDSINIDDKDETVKNKEKKYPKKTEEKTSKEDTKEDKNSWRRDKILTMKFSDTDSEFEKEKYQKKQNKIANKSKENNSDSEDEESFLKSKKKKKKKIKRRILDSDSDVKITDVDSDDLSKSSSAKNSSDSKDDLEEEKNKLKRRRHKRGDSSDTNSSFTEKKPKRKRIKKMSSDSDSSITEIKNSQGSSGKSGRKNIRKVLKDKQVADDTKLAAKEEEERLKRIAERQAVYNEMYEIRLAGEEKVEKLVLDFDTETKKELVTVQEELVKRLKPHQAQGIKFMWDACFESLERIKNTSGSGCIIAHCMGLGKTLQVVTLTHTLLTHEATNIKTVLIVCPLSTVLNWLNEYNTWLKDLDDFEIYELTKFKKNFERKCLLQRWQKTGGVMIIGYEMFRNLTGSNKNIRKGMKEVILECLIDPGADLVVCDEGHLLKNEDTALSKCIRSVKTMRRIVLTGTPLQNNLIEYHCMVQFVKPNLLGTKREFLNRFVNPITNGQFDDSTAYDVKLMKKRAHVLHKMLEGSVQRFDYSVLTPFLPPKQEYVIFVRLTDTQVKMYQYYLENFARCREKGTLFADFQALQRIWTHPMVLRLNAEKVEKANEKKELELSDSEGSLKDFINDDSSDVEEVSSSNDSSNDSDVQAIDDEKNNSNVPKRKTRNNPGEEEAEEVVVEENTELEWWLQFVQPEHFEDIRASAKLLLLFGILKESEQIGDKVLVFSQSLYSLTLIEKFLRRIDDQTQNGAPCDALENHTGSWSLGLDYFRLDGQTSPENRNAWCKIFNRPTNTRARLFLISTRAGGLGINLTAANRVIIFDASWNPSHDVQSIFRIYRFGQKKPCYVYRFLAAGTMEEKIYNRQVTKLSLSCRVVDEQQIERHYSNHNLNELYMFEGYDDKEKPTLNLPKDRLLAEIFLKFKDFVENYHEHDSLLENKAEEELDEEERKQAWLEYEEEKKGKPIILNPVTNIAHQNNMFLQQYNMIMNSIPQNISLQFQIENIQQVIRKDYPNATPEQQRVMTNRALMDMYNYWEKQATLYDKQPVQSIRNPAVMPQRSQAANFQQAPQIPNSSNAQQQQVSQLSQLLTGQSMNYVNRTQPVQSGNAQMGDLLPNVFTYRNNPNNTNENTDKDIMEVIPTTSNAGITRQSGTNSIQVPTQPLDNSKIQEE